MEAELLPGGGTYLIMGMIVAVLLGPKCPKYSHVKNGLSQACWCLNICKAEAEEL